MKHFPGKASAFPEALFHGRQGCVTGAPDSPPKEVGGYGLGLHQAHTRRCVRPSAGRVGDAASRDPPRGGEFS